MAHWLDMTTAALGLLYILLEVRGSVWMWVVGAAMQVLGIVLYFDKGLYADCGMEFYYLGMTIYGMAHWRRHLAGSGTQPDVVRPTTLWHSPIGGTTGWGSVAVLAMVAATVWAVIYWLLFTFTDSTVPLADAFTTAFSMIGIYLLARRYVEQWLVWIAVDVVTCALYFYKDIPYKASLYALYVVIAIAGFRRWRQQVRG